MFVYFIMRTCKLHEKKCKCFNGQHEHVRVHTKGVYISKASAKAQMDELNKTTSNKYFIQSYKIRDPEAFKIQIGLSVMTPLTLGNPK